MQHAQATPKHTRHHRSMAHPATLLILALVLTTATLPPQATADDTCTPTPADTCNGIAQLSTQTGGLLGARRCWQLTTDTADADACDHTTDEPTWTMDAGACVTLRYRDDTTGATPPSQAQTITLQIRYETTATVIRTLHNAAPPADNTDFTVCATNTGIAGGATRAGTLRTYIRAFNDGPGAANDYDIDSDGTNTVGASDQFTKGALRGDTVVASITTNTPPTGTYCTCFAFGPTADETATVTTTLAQPFADTNTETLQLTVYSGAATIESFTAQDQDTGSVSNAATIDQTYRFTGIASAQTWLGARVTITGTSALTGGPWTAFAAAGHGAGITINAGNAEKAQTFQASSHARFDNDGAYNASPSISANWASDTITPDADPPVYHRAETFTVTYYILNARGDKATRSLSGAGFFTGTETTATTNCMTGATGAATAGGLYTTMLTWPSDQSCTAASTQEGTPYKYRINSQSATPPTATTQWITQGTTSNLALTGLDPGGAIPGGGFIGAMYVSVGSSIDASITEYAPLFGDSGTRLDETEAYSIAPFRYNLTRLFVHAGSTNCGNLQSGETATVTVRVNDQPTILTGQCSFGVPVPSYSLDRDTIEVMPGDRITFAFQHTATASRSLEISVSVQAYTNDDALAQIQQAQTSISASIDSLALLILWVLLTASTLAASRWAPGNMGYWITIILGAFAVILSTSAFSGGLAMLGFFLSLVAMLSCLTDWRIERKDRRTRPDPYAPLASSQQRR